MKNEKVKKILADLRETLAWRKKTPADLRLLWSLMLLQ